jgi:hypothetical protein
MAFPLRTRAVTIAPVVMMKALFTFIVAQPKIVRRGRMLLTVFLIPEIKLRLPVVSCVGGIQSFLDVASHQEAPTGYQKVPFNPLDTNGGKK